MLDNVNSVYVLDIIFQNIKNKRKLKLIKYNKKILDRLNIKKNDFKIYEMLKEFNEEYNLNVDDIDNKELDLIGKYIGKEGLGYLNTLGFKQLKRLNLSDNDISDIKILEQANFCGLKE